MRTVVLVACCGEKLGGRHPARDLYRSQLFRKSRAWAERHGDQWFILSAKYGLVAPGDEIDAYDLTLNRATREYRSEWAERVTAQLRSLAEVRLVVLAGERYCQGWTSAFEHVERPLKGLAIGKQLAWLTAALSERPAFPPTYAEVLLPLDVQRLPPDLLAMYRRDPLIREWVHLHDKVRRAEKVSSWTQWTDEERAAYDAGDYAGFSRLRGYTEQEIADFRRWCELHEHLQASHDDPDFAMQVCYELDGLMATRALDAINKQLEWMSRAADQAERNPRERIGHET